MPSSIWFVLPSVLVGILGTLTGYFTARMNMRNQSRTTAGTVESSTASELWAANQRILDRLEANATQQVAQMAAQGTRMALLQDEISKLQEENIKLVRDALKKDWALADLAEQLRRLNECPLLLGHDHREDSMPAVAGG